VKITANCKQVHTEPWFFFFVKASMEELIKPSNVLLCNLAQ